ncbi:tetratricopeptide repeat protein [Kineosporia sp. R_H_3]|uniref:tetratricopeptide repeat protein n=1 Tax=Kineosporia sp. R_H_3 TaxID=1961848 RepID=UPI000B4B7E7C|nr:adenylate/guanylate cyclase domain-containing protein [Kineosporia sp. R_H_3]
MDDPQAYIAADRRRAIAAGVELPTRVRGAALFADISGFTPLTEALARELGPRRGADELSTVLGVVFEALLSRLHAHGGDVISFSGDAVTCWLDGDDGLRAVACGLAMQEAMADVGRVVTPSGTAVDLAMKVAVAVGEARRLVVGDHRVQLVDVLAGRLVDHLAAAERRATTGTVTLDASALDALGDRADVEVLPADPAGDADLPDRADLPDGAAGRRVGVLRGLRVPRPAPMPWQPPPDLPEHVVRQWLLPQVYERMRSGRGEFLAELRPAVPLFVSFGGIDYDTDPAAHAKLDEFVMEAQRVVDAYGGSTLQLTLGDKGAYLYAVFGSPLAHEDDAARACAAALELRALEGRTSATDLRIGIATGRLRSGTYGHPTRRTFCCLGDAVNVAARLMSAAAPGEIIVDGRVHRAAEDRFAWRRLAPLAVKGKSAAIQAHALEDVRAGGTGLAARLAVRFTEPMVGRVRELGLVTEVVEDVAAGSGRVLEIVAEAGMGKSRLVAEMVRVLSRSGVAVHVGESPSFGAGTSYAAWRDVWWDLLGLGGLDPDDVPAVSSALRARLESVDPGLVSRLPLLGALLDLALPDTDLTSGFDAKLRKTSLEDLAVRIVTHRASTAPLALVVEDSHWMDPLSRDLLTVLAQAAAVVPLLVVVAYRPAGAGEPGTGLEVLAHRRALELEALDDDVVAALVRSLVRARTPDAGDVPEVLVERVVGRSAGNPFYVEELVTYLLERADGRFTGVDVETLDMPESLAALVLSRIDTLAEGPRTTAKVASVVGRSFTGTALRAVHPDLGDRAGVDADLDVLREVDLLTLDDAATRLHAFRHVIVRDVAYESMPHGVRTRLHERAGDHVAATASTAGGQLLDLVAYHYVRGGDDAKKRSALLAAGAAARARYANSTAIEHYRAVLPLLDDGARGPVLLALGQVLELTAAWDDADRAYTQARAHADAVGDRAATGWADVALAEVARKQGRFADAEDRLAEAADAFTALVDEVGLGRVLHLRGTLAAQQGRYDDARAHYEASLVVRERLGDRAQAAALLSNLGVIAEYTGDYAAARALNEQALALRTQVGDRWAIGVSQNNLGMIALLTEDFVDAKARFTEAMRLNLEVGDAWMVAIAHNNLANALRGLGDLDGARAGYARALEAYQRWDDRWALAILLEDVAVTATRLGARADALRLLGAAETLRAEIGSPRSPSDETGLAEVLTPAGPDDESLLAEGRALTLPAAADLALAVCR